MDVGQDVRRESPLEDLAMREARFDVGWTPPAILRGNARGHWTKRKAAIAEMRESGFAHGLGYLNAGNAPLTPPYALDVRFTVKRTVDVDNLLIGLKAFIDGVQDSGAIADDKRIERITADRRKGEPRTEITIRERG